MHRSVSISSSFDGSLASRSMNPLRRDGWIAVRRAQPCHAAARASAYGTWHAQSLRGVLWDCSHIPLEVILSPIDRRQATTFLTWKASARREGALHSTPRSRNSDQKVSSSNHCRLAWDGNDSNSPAILSRQTSSESGT